MENGTMRGYKKLMIAVLANELKAYIHAVKVGGVDFSTMLKEELTKADELKKKNCKSKQLRMIKTMTRGEEAKHYIFDDSQESGFYVFGFKFICTFIGIDPERLRERIKEKRIKFWKNVYKGS